MEDERDGMAVLFAGSGVIMCSELCDTHRLPSVTILPGLRAYSHAHNTHTHTHTFRHECPLHQTSRMQLPPCFSAEDFDLILQDFFKSNFCSFTFPLHRAI